MGMKSVVPYVAMGAVQFAEVGLLMLGKEAMSNGMTKFTFIFYYNALASILLLPSSFLVHRSDRPPLTFPVLCCLISLGILGCLIQVAGYAGIQYTSATFASTMLNLNPGFTFLLAIIFRMEKLDCRSSSTMAKSIGTVVSIAGAFIVTLYKGPQLLSHSNSLHHHLLPHFSNWIIGALLLAVNCLFSSAYNIAQVFVLRKYPSELTIGFFGCFVAAIFSAILCMLVERDPSAWSLQTKIRMLAVLYSGIFGSAFRVSISLWCLRRTGPLFIAMFHPLGIVISTAMGIIFLDDPFFLGSLLGSIVIVVGFYSVTWGKAKEGKIMVENSGVNRLESGGEKDPLLQNNVKETQA